MRAAAALAAAACLAAAAAAATLDAAFVEEGLRLGDTGQAIVALGGWRPRPTRRIALGQGGAVATIGPKSDDYASLADLPRVAVDAFVAAEDRTFWDNPGIDPAAIARSALRDALRHAGRPAGASTITQQLAKIAFLRGDSATPRRKVEQAILALRIAAAIPKRKVMELYLNRAYLGHGATGIAAASRAYWGEGPGSLTAPQAALLAGLAANPTLYDPARNPKAAEMRRNEVLRQMAADGLMRASEAERLEASPLALRAAPPASDPASGIEGLGWAIDRARSEAGAASRGSLTLTVSPALQSAAQWALQRAAMAWDARRRGWQGRLPPGQGGDAAADAARACAGQCPAWATAATVVSSAPGAVRLRIGETEWTATPDGFGWIAATPSEASRRLRPGDRVLAGNPGGAPDGARLAQPTALDGSAVAVRASDGAILAIAGGKRWSPGAFDRATMALRPPGSAFKPFVYLTALRSGFAPGTTVFDIPVAIADGHGGTWEPSDDDGAFDGAMTMSEALAASRNAPAARLALQLGTKAISGTAAAFGIYREVEGLASSLGTQEATNLALTSAYAALAAGGTLAPAHVTEEALHGATVQVADPADVAELDGMLRGVMREGGTASALEGFGDAMSRRGFPAAGKTGTSSGNRDAWFVGYAGGVAVGVQLGYDSPRSLGDDAFGAGVAGPAFASIMESAEKAGLLSHGKE